MDSEDNQKQITRLINISTMQPRIIKLNLNVCQKYMVFVPLEMERNCKAGKPLTEIEMDWYEFLLQQ